MERRFTWVSVPMLIAGVVAAAFALFPFYAIFLASLKPAEQVTKMGLSLKIDPDIMSFHNYVSLFTESAGRYFTWFQNSLLLTLMGTVVSLFFSSLVGFGLAMYQFRLRNLIFILVLLVMMVPMEIIMLPLYKLTIGLRLIDSYWGVVLPFAVAPLPVFFFRQFASGLPKDFADAARIDGCTEYGMFFRIFVPLMTPAFGAMTILQALGNWNNFLWPLIVLRSDSKLTIPIGLSTLLTPYGNNYEMLLAGSVLAVLPILILFVFFQRYFISGLTAGGIRG